MAVQGKVGAATLWIILLFVGLMSVLPFLWVVLGSFKTHIDIQSGYILPWESARAKPVEPPADDSWGETVRHWGRKLDPERLSTWYVTADNYDRVLKKLSGLPTYYLNTIYLSAAGTFLSLLVGTLAAYGFARFRFFGNRLIFAMLLLTIMIPGEVMLIGRFELMFQLGLFDKVVGLLLAYVAGGLLLIIFIMRNVFASIPQDITDAAMIDGASHWQVFWEIMVPMGGNGIAACGILTFLGIWNEFLFALTFTSTDRARTLPVGIVLLQSQWGLFDSGVLFATVLLSFLPIVIVFILLQKYFVSGLSAGAIKQ